MKICAKMEISHHIQVSSFKTISVAKLFFGYFY